MPDPRPEFGEFAALQWTRTELCRLLRDFFRAQRPQGAPPVRVGTDLPFFYDPADKLARFTPDLYVLHGVPQGDEVLRSFRVWERGGLTPALVVHLVDSAMAPEDGLLMHCARLGVQDVVLFDPLWNQQPPQSPAGRRPLWHYRREDGLVLQPQEHPGRLPLPQYNLWLSHRGGGELRVYAGAPDAFPPEENLWPTAEEQLAGHPRPAVAILR